jgi:4-alpha-glucanotransferase
MTNITGAEAPIEKYAGILAHPTSFPSPYGIGDLGDGAYRFIDFLAKSGLNLWQVLPLGHTGFGDSPYQPFSSFAGQPLIISLDFLKRVNLLYDSDFQNMPHWDPVKVEYGPLIEFKTGLLHLAYERFLDETIADGITNDEALLQQYTDFCEHTFWLDDYALFMAGKDYHEGAPWYLWEDTLKKPTAKQKQTWLKKLEKEVGYYKFIQFLFHHDWTLVKQYANDKGIKIVGDIPIFVAWDSVDVWCNPSLFKLD